MIKDNENNTREFVEIESKNGCALLQANNQIWIEVPSPGFESDDFVYDFINMKLHKNWDKALLVLEDSEYTKEIYELIVSKISPDYPIIRILNEVSEIFLRRKTKNLKFRGDYAEAAYLAFKGGVWVDGNKTYDIKHDGENVEVKSVAPQKKTISISIEQLRSNSRKWVYPLRESTEGLTIIQLADMIANSNSKFSKKLKDTYGDDKECSTEKFELMKFEEVTDQLSKYKEIPLDVKRGTLEIDIKFKNSNI